MHSMPYPHTDAHQKALKAAYEIHPKPRRTVPTPVVAAIGIVGLAVVFGAGFAAGTTFEPDSGGRDARPVIEHTLARAAQPVFVKMPEELP